MLNLQGEGSYAGCCHISHKSEYALFYFSINIYHVDCNCIKELECNFPLSLLTFITGRQYVKQITANHAAYLISIDAMLRSRKTGGDSRVSGCTRLNQRVMPI